MQRVERRDWLNHLSTTIFFMQRLKTPLSTIRRYTGVRRFSPAEKTTMVGIGLTGAGLGSLSGVGGGIIMIPLMSKFTPNLIRVEATAISLFGVAVNAIVSSTTFVLMGLPFDVISASVIGGSAAITSVFGARAGKNFAQSQLTLYFACLALFVAFFVPIYGYIKKTQARSEIDYKYYVHAAFGVMGGFLSGLLGVGGAIFYVPLLLSTTDMPQVKIVGTSIACTLLPSLIGCFTHYKLGNLRPVKASFVALGAVIGAIIGSRLAKQAPEDLLRNIFSLMVLGVAIKQFRLSRSLRAAEMISKIK
jgi:uncharacterized membrane protein YfcA